LGCSWAEIKLSPLSSIAADSEIIINVFFILRLFYFIL